MVGRSKLVRLLVFLLLIIFLASAVYAAPPESFCYSPVSDADYDYSGIDDTTPVYKNFFICPPYPDFEMKTENPSLYLNLTKDMCDTERMDLVRKERGYRNPLSAAETYQYTSELSWKLGDEDSDNIEFQLEGAVDDLSDLCYRGREGIYYGIFQIDTVPGGYFNEEAREAFCIVEAYNVNFDSDEKFCFPECVNSTGEVDWADTIQGCCGDDADPTDEFNDCALTTMESSIPKVCIKQGSDWEWYPSSDSTKGQIKIMDAPCEGAVLMTGDYDLNSGFFICDNQTGTSVSEAFAYVEDGGVKHHYICHNLSGQRSLAECHIETELGASPFSVEGTASKGTPVTLEGSTYYCTIVNNLGSRNPAYTYWNSDLDDLEFEDGSNCFDAKLLDGSKGNFKFTGSKCCGEPEDVDEEGNKESYNDPDGYEAYMANLEDMPFQMTEGACWDGKFVPDGTIPQGRLVGDVVAYHGKFEGCNIDNDDEVLLREDFHATRGATSERLLVNNNPSCTLLENATGPEGHLFCSFDGRWEETDDSNKNSLSQTSWVIGESISRGCCNSTQCWNGSTCIDNQLYDSTSKVYGGSYRCVNGGWSDQMLPKRTWDNSEAGFCPMNSQCLLNPSPYAPRNCINDGEYEENKYCEDGIWTTRTKFLITSLLEYAGENYPSDYTLFCDDYQNIFNNYNYAIEGASLNTYLDENQCGGKDCVNQICVLKVPNGIVLGTSVNIPIDSDNSFLGALGKNNTICNDAKIKNGQFDRCRDKDIWYQHDMELVVKISNGLPSFGVTSWWESFVSFVSSPFKSIGGLFSGDQIEGQFFNQTTHFSKIYARVKGDKEVFAFLEEGKTIVLPGGSTRSNIDYFGLEYKNIGITPCSLIRNYDPSISCSDDQNIFSQSTLESDTNLVQAWPDLTSKLRIE